MADYIATSALGLLSNRFAYHSGPLDAKLELTAFWAPFLLLHLGGPDTITAYSLEDNQLWSRHLLQLVGQTGLAFYILFAGWTGSRLSFLTISIMLAGLIKYGERTWVMWSANREQHSVSTSSYHNMMQALSNVQDYSNLSDDKLLQLANGMFDMAKILFAGLPISATEQSALANHKEVITTLLEKASPKDAFKVIEMQLGFMYDMLYTKALVTYTPCGIGLRFISFLLTSIVLVLFSLEPNNKQTYSKVDLHITFLLLAVAILLELYATLVLLLSDHTVVWLRKHNCSNISLCITCLPLLRNPRWSNSMGQFSLLSYTINEKPMDFHGIQKFLKVNEKLERQRYAAYRQVSEDLKEQLVIQAKIFWDRVKKRQIKLEAATIASMSIRGATTLQVLGLSSDEDIIIGTLTYTIEFQQTILVWHIATELCYHRDHDEIKPGFAEYDVVISNRKMSKLISRYMMYLLAVFPDKLPESGAAGQKNFQLTCDEARKALESFKPELDQVGTTKERKRKIIIQASKGVFEQQGNLITDESQIGSEQLAGSLLSLGCKVANILSKHKPDDSVEQHMKTKWDIIAGVWMEFLVYAGRQCTGSQHAQQLRQGESFSLTSGFSFLS
ncbi:unnamed protein product [Dovyalis caffra]|uniref:DUF4220 domain-containing protein n=1 Tax=Dovyalis caffra TaxID=77055 RepID=A0AAV1QVS6_9ROSI|nr:unnamed protein product [Dovyalis caffra]